MPKFMHGDRVFVLDPGLEELRRIMRDVTGEDPQPNNTGTVDYVEDEYVYINFDDGVAAPYPLADVRRFET